MQEKSKNVNIKQKEYHCIKFVALKAKMFSFTTYKPLLYLVGEKIWLIKENSVVKVQNRAICSLLTHQNYFDIFY